MFVCIKVSLKCAEYNCLAKTVSSVRRGGDCMGEQSWGAGNPWMSKGTITVNSTCGLLEFLKLIDTFCFFDKFN